jgi:site-specific DNA-methyltransferase (adenine-specific)
VTTLTVSEAVSALPKPYYESEGITIYHGDCREILPWLEADSVITDPPYPNAAGHFTDAVGAAEDVCRSFDAPHWLVFWDEMTMPPVPLPLVARHIWHRTNTNRPDNYEPIYEFSKDPDKRPSRVLPYAVIAPGLTGCLEATGHPTQKNVKLMRRLVQMTEGLIVDPFMGSGTTLRAAMDLGRRAVGIEIDERWCEVAVGRLGQGVLSFGGEDVDHQWSLWLL